MPEVAGRHFAYTKKGKAAAQRHAKKTNKAVTHGRAKSTTKRAYS